MKINATKTLLGPSGEWCPISYIIKHNRKRYSEHYWKTHYPYTPRVPNEFNSKQYPIKEADDFFNLNSILPKAPPFKPAPNYENPPDTEILGKYDKKETIRQDDTNPTRTTLSQEQPVYVQEDERPETPPPVENNQNAQNAQNAPNPQANQEPDLAAYEDPADFMDLFF